MDVLLRHQPVSDFGADPLNPHPDRGVDAVGGETSEELRQQIKCSCPRVPGVYGMLNRKGELIYVGKSKSLRSRLLSYFAASSSEQKGGQIIEQARAIQWETQPHDFAALVREQQLIRRFTPRWNVQGMPQRQRPVYLCLGRRPAATFFLASKPPSDCVAVEGPFHGARRMNQAVEALNKVFQLRDCSQKQTFRFAEQLPLFDPGHRPGCLRLELGTCLGPCAAGCTRAEYDAQVRAAEQFLGGSGEEPAVVIEEQMQQAAAHHQFELAARARDTLESLQYVQRKLAMLASARRDYSFVYAASGYDGCSIWYLIHNGEIADVAPAPRNRDQYTQLKPTLERWQASLANRSLRGHGVNPHTLALVASWFRKHRGELKRTFAPREAGRKYYRRPIQPSFSAADQNVSG